MKYLVAGLALLLAASPAAAKAKVWVDQECRVFLSSENDVFTFGEVEGQSKDCTIAEWPVSTPIATLACNDGSRSTLEPLDQFTVIFDNAYRMNAYDGPLPCGQDGMEWPD